MVFVEIDIGVALNQRVEFKQLLAEYFREKAVVKAALVEDADIGFAADDIADDIDGAGLEHRELVLIRVKTPGHIGKGLGHKGVVLGRDRKTLPDLAGSAEAVHQELILLVEFSRACQKFRAVRCQADAARVAVKETEAQFFLSLFDGVRESGLREEELFRGAVDAAGIGDFREIIDLLKRHDSLLLYSRVIGIRGDTNTQNRAKQGKGICSVRVAVRGDKGMARITMRHILCARRRKSGKYTGKRRRGMKIVRD